ncbi:lanthionine synthetase LanC family protein [Streptococcus sp. H49]|uniref:lanthionine synthetase LanC family protein n=1 Tax=Streptococcus huangxiaojuni TaxID=3237239 RepID=UPI0034A321F5
MCQNCFIRTRTGYHDKQPFPLKQAEKAEDYLNLAIQAAEYIDQFKVETEDGIWWRNTNNEAQLSISDFSNPNFFSGSAGILYFYDKLYQITHDTTYLSIIRKASHYLTQHWQILAKLDIFDMAGAGMGLYGGIGGVGLIQLEIAENYDNEEALKSAQEIADYYLERAKQTDKGICWTGDSPLFHDSGILLFLIKAYQHFPSSRLLETIKSGVRYLIANGHRHIDNGLEINTVSAAEKRDLPNWEFGSAGAGYLFGKTYELTHEQDFLQAAKDAAVFLVNLAVPQKEGYLIPYRTNGPQRQVFYLGNCHGAIGTSRFFYYLYQLTEDSYYLEQVEALTAGLISRGAPERQSNGYWNTTTFCCGAAGFIHHFLGLYADNKKTLYLDLARRSAAVVLGNASRSEKGISFPIAFNRISPSELSAFTGFYDGAAGIATALLELYQFESQQQLKWKRLIDDPFISLT